MRTMSCREAGKVPTVERGSLLRGQLRLHIQKRTAVCTEFSRPDSVAMAGAARGSYTYNRAGPLAIYMRSNWSYAFAHRDGVRCG